MATGGAAAGGAAAMAGAAAKHSRRPVGAAAERWAGVGAAVLLVSGDRAAAELIDVRPPQLAALTSRKLMGLADGSFGGPR